jgi:hypothetical protein
MTGLTHIKFFFAYCQENIIILMSVVPFEWHTVKALNIRARLRLNNAEMDWLRANYDRPDSGNSHLVSVNNLLENNSATHNNGEIWLENEQSKLACN